MKTIIDITYGPLDTHKLDLYLPEGTPRALMVYFFGGGLVAGNKNSVAKTAQGMTQAGFAVASVAYRLIPQVHYPDFLTDCALGVAYLRAHPELYGGAPMFVNGSSAGGYISMMLCFDRQYLGKHGIKPTDMAGFIFDAGQPTNHFNLLKERGLDSRRVIVDETAPLYHIGTAETYPPMLFILAEKDMDGRKEQTMVAAYTLRHFGHDTPVITIPGTTHCSYLRDEHNAEYVETIRCFIEEHI